MPLRFAYRISIAFTPGLSSTNVPGIISLRIVVFRLGALTKKVRSNPSIDRFGLRLIRDTNGGTRWLESILSV